MAIRIEIAYREGVRDVPAEKLKKRIELDLGVHVDAHVVDVYTVDSELPQSIVELLVSDAFIDPVLQTAYVEQPAMLDADWVVEVGFKPGVTDNVGRTAKEVIEALSGLRFGEEEGVYTSRLYFFKGTLDEAGVKSIAEGLLANTLINRYVYKPIADYIGEKGMGTYVPKATIRHEPQVEWFDVGMDVEAFLAINRERTWALSKEELLAIKEHFSRPDVKAERKAAGLPNGGIGPTDVEMEALAQTWSEHCKHKIFNAAIEYNEDGRTEPIDSLFKTYIVGSTSKIRQSFGRRDFCLSVFKDNAGIIKFDNKYNLAYKVETHNTPSALDPYGGALTGIVGVNRDPFGSGKGARLLFNTDIFCFAPPDYKGVIPPRLLHPKRVLEGVREGVEHGGNKSGIPTVNGSLVFDRDFLGKPLVYCGTCGIMPAIINGEPSYMKRAHKGDLIVMVGGRIGKDGIHGATFSSEELSEASPTSAVQIGDPITQKRMTDFLLLARDQGLYTSITDNGAGGLSSSVGEMAEDTNGCILHLERAPLKYHGLDPWEILLSEAQERMTVAVNPDKIDRFLALSEKMNVLSTVLGEFTDSGKFHVMFQGKTVSYLDMDFLHNGYPRMQLRATWTRKIRDEEPPAEPTDCASLLLAMLGRWNICSKEYVVRQYDHEVQAGTIVKPLAGKENEGPSDAGVIRPDPGSIEGIVVSHGICPKYSQFDTYHMTALAIDEAIRNNVATGGSLDRMALLDNFCWCDPVASERNPDGEYKLAQLVRANKALYDYTVTFGTPCISGKDSMKNDYMHGDLKISIPPTILISAISRIRDVTKSVTIDFKEAGDLIIAIGMTRAEMAGSEYFSHLGLTGNIPPKVDGRKARQTYRALERAIRSQIIRSAHDVSDGGIGVTLAESAFAGGLGASVDVSQLPRTGIYRDDFLLFSESASRFVVSIKEADLPKFKQLFRSVAYAVIGRVTADARLVVKGLHGSVVIDIDTKPLKEAWQAPFKNLFG
ncbi:MAG TPA: AIR synthase-related protein [Syntrophorhabdales bacterium]|nr:AIR synthase-related protein [Syntrophorhabdales bacterium]